MKEVTSMAKTNTFNGFWMCVEGKEGFDRFIPWTPDEVPHIIKIGPHHYTLVGKYAVIGERFSYERHEVVEVFLSVNTP